MELRLLVGVSLFIYSNNGGKQMKQVFDTMATNGVHYVSVFNMEDTAPCYSCTHTEAITYLNMQTDNFNKMNEQYHIIKQNGMK